MDFDAILNDGPETNTKNSNFATNPGFSSSSFAPGDASHAASTDRAKYRDWVSAFTVPEIRQWTEQAIELRFDLNNWKETNAYFLRRVHTDDLVRRLRSKMSVRDQEDWKARALAHAEESGRNEVTSQDEAETIPDGFFDCFQDMLSLSAQPSSVNQE